MYKKAFDRLSRKLTDFTLPTIYELSHLFSLALDARCIEAGSQASATDRIEIIASMYLATLETLDEKNYDYTVAFVCSHLTSPILFKKVKTSDELELDLAETPSWLLPVEECLNTFFCFPNEENLEKILSLLERPIPVLTSDEKKELEEFVYKKLAINHIDRTHTSFPYTIANWKTTILFSLEKDLEPKISDAFITIFTQAAFSKRSLSKENKLSTLIRVISFYHEQFIKERSLPSLDTLTYLKEVFHKTYRKYHLRYDLKRAKIMLQNLNLGYRNSLITS